MRNHDLNTQKFEFIISNTEQNSLHCPKYDFVHRDTASLEAQLTECYDDEPSARDTVALLLLLRNFSMGVQPRIMPSVFHISLSNYS